MNVQVFSLQQIKDTLRAEVGEVFSEASNHPYTCRCDACREWWLAMGHDPDMGRYGPFTEEEIDAPPKTI